MLFSFHPCLPYVRSAIHSRAPSLDRNYPASSVLRTPPPPSRLKSTSRCCRLYDRRCFRQFPGGTRRASPVAQRILVSMLSVSPRRRGRAHRSDCATPCCLRPIFEGSTFGV